MLNTITMNTKTHTLRVLTDLDKAIHLATAARKNLASSSPKEAYYLLLRVSDRLEDAILAACDLYGGDFRKLPEPEEIDDPLDNFPERLLVTLVHADEGFRRDLMEEMENRKDLAERAFILEYAIQISWNLADAQTFLLEYITETE